MGEDQMDFSSIVGVNPPPETQTPPLASVMQPQQDIVTQARKPAASPEDLESRIQGWTSVINRVQTDPNLQQAMLMAGAAMMQPIQPGESLMGNLGKAAVIGTSAYNMGKQTEMQNKLLASRESRAQAEETRASLRAPLERQTMETTIAANKAKVRSAEAQAKLDEGTVEDKIRLAGVSRRQAELAQSESEKDAALKDLTRDNAAIVALLDREDLPEKRRLALEKERQQNELLLAQVQERKAKAGQEEQAGAMGQLTLDTLKKLPEEDLKKAVLTKFQGHNASSAVVQQMDAWGSIYDKLPADDPSKAGRTKEQYQAAMLKQGNAQDATKSLKAYIDAGGDDADIIEGFNKVIKTSLQERTRPNPAGEPKPAPKVGQVVNHPSGKWRYKGGDPNDRNSWEKVK